MQISVERISLAFPIEHDGLPIKEIALRRPTVGDHLGQRRSRLAPTPSARFG
ncbi:MAG: phage tail assembly protein [Acidovorax sp.]